MSLVQNIFGTFGEKKPPFEKTLSENAKQLLMEYYWPGNIRELRNVMSRISIMSPTSEITRETLSTSLQLANYKLNDNLNKKSGNADQ